MIHSHKILIALLFSGLLVTGCASLFKSERQRVRFKVPEGEQVSLITPDGRFEISDMNGHVNLTNNYDLLPVTVICNKKTRHLSLIREFDPLYAVLGNVIFGILPGMAVDMTTGSAYRLKSPVDLATACQ